MSSNLTASANLRTECTCKREVATRERSRHCDPRAVRRGTEWLPSFDWPAWVRPLGSIPFQRADAIPHVHLPFVPTGDHLPDGITGGATECVEPPRYQGTRLADLIGRAVFEKDANRVHHRSVSRLRSEPHAVSDGAMWHGSQILLPSCQQVMAEQGCHPKGGGLKGQAHHAPGVGRRPPAMALGRTAPARPRTAS